MRFFLPGSLVAVTLSLVVAMLIKPDTAAQTTDLDLILAGQKRLERRLAEQQLALDALEKRQMAPVAAVLAPQPASPQKVDKIDPQEVEPVPQPEVEPVPLEVKLEAAFAQESVDAAWAEATSEVMVQQWLPILPPGSRLNDVDCRQSMCRVEIQHNQVEGHEAMMDKVFSGRVFWPGPGSYDLVTSDSGQVSTVAYLGRPDATPEQAKTWQ